MCDKEDFVQNSSGHFPLLNLSDTSPFQLGLLISGRSYDEEQHAANRGSRPVTRQCRLIPERDQPVPFRLCLAVHAKSINPSLAEVTKVL